MFLEQNGSLFDLKLHSTTQKALPSMYHFVDAIVTDTPHPATGYEGLLVMQILDSIYKSAETGEPVHIP
jgi:predicted dehydrogenase